MDVSNPKLITKKLKLTAENFFAVILVLKTLSFVKAILLYLGI